MRPLATTFLMLMSLFSVLHLVNAHAAPDPVTLPTLTVMADRELREETEFMLPLQEQSSQKKALKMRMMKIERELQDYSVNADFAGDLDILPSTNPARLDSLPPGLQQYVQAIADGLRSADPREGVYLMLVPFGIDRNVSSVQAAREQFNLNNIDRSLVNEWCAVNAC
ncbi:hypothetical protein A3K93_00630 [Acinetobacter sp. NCu2D-2]|uniref:hypothetical protein n=1 Tax=Acinetobacter sp. NCu2D-2 TaxID=1608473 RepID=UPI0007CDF32A|nr:hypothetical protein [Acinetobacter sp. NCu2D-2]ANF80838.1 hypothetical protein A3K93_00630 [Acinetobacter sp. NCu2D-2]